MRIEEAIVSHEQPESDARNALFAIELDETIDIQF